MRPAFILILFSLSLSERILSQTCSSWSQAKELGKLDVNIINQASGIAHSSVFFDRLFHVNEAEDGPFFYMTDLKGNYQKTIKIENFFPEDVEDLAYGTCGDSLDTTEQCLIVGDIGDNYLRRTKPLQLIFIKDQENFSNSVKPFGTIYLNYPNGQKHDAEGVAMHPNGDIFLLTKDVNFQNRTVASAHLFKVAKKLWQNFPSQPITMEEVGSIDLGFLLFEDGFWGRQATGLDISPDGKSFLIITYKNALEIHTDLSRETLKPSRHLRDFLDYHIIKLKHLPQQEAVTYLKGTDRETLVYSTSYHGASVPLMAVFCNTRKDLDSTDIP